MKHEQKWIVENCRTNPIETLGPRPDLYERWQEPNIDHIETPEPAVPTRRPTPPLVSNKIEFEQEIVSLHLPWTRGSSETSSCCTNTSCYCHPEETDDSKTCCRVRGCLCHVGRCCSNVDCVCDVQVDSVAKVKVVKSAHVRGAVYDCRWFSGVFCFIRMSLLESVFKIRLRLQSLFCAVIGWISKSEPITELQYVLESWLTT